MDDEKQLVRTNKDVQRIYQQAKTLQQSDDWQMPQHDWNVEKLQQLQVMALPELIEHLRVTVATKVTLDNLKDTNRQKTVNYVRAFNDELDELKKRFKHYTYLNQHPVEIAYRREHHVKHLPTAKHIDNRSTKIAKIGFFATIILASYDFSSWGNFLSNPIYTGLPLMLLIVLGFVGFGLLYFAAKLNLPFSQPWAMYHNHRIKSLVNRIHRADERYCQENKCDEATLRKRFKFHESVTASRGVYFEKMNAEEIQTRENLNGYVTTLKEHVAYFPMDDMQDVRHVFRIYKLLINGRATNWKEAAVLVDEDERIHQLKQTLVDEIHAAKGDIINSITQASEKITQSVQAATKSISDVQSSLEDQTRRMDEWNQEQTEIMYYQTGIMQDSNDRINEFYGRKQKYW